MDISKYSSEDFKATYSPEDNKLRLYADVRIDKEDWLEMKDNGWKWAPKQELFFSFWKVSNEDFCLSLAGDIMPEEMTMVERAELKADRLLILAQKRSSQCIGYQKAANDLMMRIDHNQPILSGHHSQRKAEKTELQVKRNVEKAEETADAVGYWVWRARGVIGHADYKNNTRTIYNRIKTLLKDLRTQQRYINDAAKRIDTVVKLKAIDDLDTRTKFTLVVAGDSCVFEYGYYSKIKDGEISADEALDQLLEGAEKTVNSPGRARIINHILNRLAYEQEQLNIVPVYGEKLTPAVLQTFLRTHGADKPKVTKTDFGWLAVSSVCLPLHINSSTELELDDQDWRVLMQSVGYEVPAKKVVLPTLNFKTDKQLSYRMYDVEHMDQVEMTKAEYKAILKQLRHTATSACNTFRYKYASVPKFEGCAYYQTRRVAVFITDATIHPVPDSMLTVEA